MKTTFSMILERICALLDIQPVYAVRKHDGPVRAVEPYQTGQPTNSNTLYISPFLPAPHERPLQLLCTNGEDGPAGSGNLAVFQPAVSHSQLLSIAQSALSFFSDWGDSVLELIYANKGIDAIVRFAYDTFKNPILIYDSSLKVLAYTKNDGSTDRMWRDTVQRGSVNSMNAEEAHEFLLYVNKLDNSSKPFKHAAKDLTDPFYNGNILLNGQRVGMVDLMERNHPITQGEIDLLEAFCYLLSFELQKDAIRRENRGLIYNQLIVDLLDGNIKDAASLRTRLTATRWMPAAFTRVVSFRPVNAFMADLELRRAFDHLLTLSIGRGILRGREIILLLACTQPKWSSDFQHILQSFCGAHQLRCGVSDAYENLLETNLIAPQADLALTLGEEQLVLYDSVRFSNLLNLCRSQPCLSEFLHPVVLQLAAHDAQCSTDYLDTLEALLNSQYNQMLSARALHIHRTTLIYRLQRICEMTGLRLDDAREMLYVHFSLCVYRSMQSKPEGQ